MTVGLPFTEVGGSPLSVSVGEICPKYSSTVACNWSDFCILLTKYSDRYDDKHLSCTYYELNMYIYHKKFNLFHAHFPANL